MDPTRQARPPTTTTINMNPPATKCSGFVAIRKLGLLPYTERYGVQIVSVNRGTHPQCEGCVPRTSAPNTGEVGARCKNDDVTLAHPTLDLWEEPAPDHRMRIVANSQ